MRKSQNDSPRATQGYFYTPGVLALLEETAAKLLVDADTLRDTCEREAYVCGDTALVQLAGGITGFRTRGVWRFRFPVLGPEHAPPAGGDR